MLAAGAAEARQAVARDVVAALHADLLDRVRHVLDGDPQEPLGHLLGRACRSSCGERRRTPAARRAGVERLVAVGAEDRREECGRILPSMHIGVGDRQRAAAAVAGGPGIGAGALGPDAEARAVEAQDRAAAGRHGVDLHHRRAHAHAGDLGLEAPARSSPAKWRDVGRGAAHVEADDPRRARPSAPVRTAPTTPPAGPDRMASLPWKRRRVGQPADDCMNIAAAMSPSSSAATWST